LIYSFDILDSTVFLPIIIGRSETVLTSRKALFSLLITVILFTVFTGFAFTGLFDLIEARFYNPSVTAHTVSENNRNARIIEEFFTTLENRFSETLKTGAVRRGLMSEKNQEDFFAVSEIFKTLTDSFINIQWVRLIDSGGRKLHFSTYSPDILDNNYLIPFYHNYNEPDLPYDLIAVGNGGAPKYTIDNKSGRILFSFPLYDYFDIYCGTALFSLPLDAILDKLLSEGRMIFGHEIMLIQNPPGMMFGNLAAGERVMPAQISSVWEAEGQKTARLSSPDSGVHFILISTKTSQGLFIGSLIKEDLYLFPWNMKLILLVSLFLTMYLTIFLLFSLKQEPVTIIQNRLKNLQVSLLEQFYELRGDEDWSRWIREMEYRRKEISSLLKQGIRPASGSLNEEIDALINKSWDEFLSLLGSRREPGFDEEKLRSAITSILEALPKTGRETLSGGEVSPKKEKTGLLRRASAIVKELEETDLVEEVEELEELEEVEEIETVEAPDTSPAPPGIDLAALASQIEFSTETEPEPDEEDSIEHDLEIVSPFASMLGGFTDTMDYDISSIGEETLEQIFGPSDENDSLNDDSWQEVEIIQNRGQPLITKPFSMAGKNKVETLEALTEEQSPIERGSIIEEKEGIPFVSANAINPDEKEEKFINRDFKDLVDSVIKD
jgi:hypothetical protein